MWVLHIQCLILKKVVRVAQELYKSCKHIISPIE
jgi:hypothetical protein